MNPPTDFPEPPDQNTGELMRRLDFSRLLLENMEAGVVACDENGKLVLLNRVAREWHGLEMSDVSQSEWAGHYDLFEADGATPMTLENTPLLRAFRGEVIKDVELVIAPKAGLRREVRCSGSRVLDEDGQVVGAVIVVNDITERNRIEDALREREHLLREAQVVAGLGTYTLDIPTGLWKCSGMMDQLFGIDAAYERTVEGWAALIHPDDRDLMADYFKNEVLGMGRAFDKEYRIVRHNDQALRWVHGLGKLEFDAGGHPTKMLGTIQDITGRKSLEAELIEALDQAESANRAKSDFLAVMSHELRTPLNGVLGFAELLSETQLNEEQKDYARTISQSGNHLLDVVNDILDFSSIEEGRLILETAPLTLAELVETSARAARKVALDKGLDFQWDVEPGTPSQVVGDERRIRQILINLLGNAVKFTTRGSVHLHVAISSALNRDTLDFSVEDTGPGLSADTIALLFKPFTQADTTLHRQFEGTGLGLAISQRLAKAMGGSITVSSIPGKGSTFTFHLLIEVPDSLPPTPPLPREKNPTATVPAAHGVLVVEDDPANCKLTGKMVVSLGYQAEFAFNGREAVAAFAPGKFSAILMDMQMPVMDGLEATRIIRATEAAAGGRVPIIALTANVMPGDCERCLAAGMDEFLSKPFKKADLAEKLAGALKSIL
jgi:PAS domain S-box-containing protein